MDPPAILPGSSIERAFDEHHALVTVLLADELPCFSATGLSYQGQCLSLSDPQIYAVHGLYDTLIQRKMSLKVFDL